MESEKLNDILDKAKNEILSNTKGDLSLLTRKNILKLFGEYEFKNNRAMITIGLKRRMILGSICVKKVIDVWNDVAEDDKRPLEMLEIARQYVDGKVEYKIALEKLNEFTNDLINLSSVDEYFKAVFVGFAATHTLSIALSDERRIIYGEDSDLDSDYGPESWETSYYAYLAYIDGNPWDKSFDAEQSRKFWLWYIDEAVPKAYTSYN